ncbi:hypothetical protein PSHT_15520 [Puccinia striiformis]|uniref:C2H2-type domain-containing protein n=1 Tax=Puccinia striiformis TaxID=27350 RepID=A0A2S4UEM9_9BASI|nr:hypothetical protein PSHT_15520 [Puccinia striiformis]
MAHPHPLPVGERNSSPIHPDVWVELNPSSMPYESSAVSIPGAQDVSNLDLKSYCTGFDAHYGPGEILLPLLDDTNIYSLAMPLPHETSYKALEGTMFKNEEAGGAYQQCHEASPNFLFSTSVGYESSLSPSSSRPCTAGYEVDGTSFSSSAAEPPLPLLYGCGFSPTEGSSFYSHFDQTAIEAKASAKFAPAINHNTFPLQYMPPYLIQQSNGLIGPQEEMNTMLDPPVDLQFPTVSTTTHATFRSICRKPTSLVSHQAVNGKPKARFLNPVTAPMEKHRFYLVTGKPRVSSPMRISNIHLSHSKEAQRRRDDRNERILPPRFYRRTTQPVPNFKARLHHHRAASIHQVLKTPQNDRQDLRTTRRLTESILQSHRQRTQEVCGRKFQRSEHLKRHWATHDDLKPFQMSKM